MKSLVVFADLTAQFIGLAMSSRSLFFLGCCLAWICLAQARDVFRGDDRSPKCLAASGGFVPRSTESGIQELITKGVKNVATSQLAKSNPKLVSTNKSEKESFDRLSSKAYRYRMAVPDTFVKRDSADATYAYLSDKATMQASTNVAVIQPNVNEIFFAAKIPLAWYLPVARCSGRYFIGSRTSRSNLIRKELGNHSTL